MAQKTSPKKAAKKVAGKKTGASNRTGGKKPEPPRKAAAPVKAAPVKAAPVEAKAAKKGPAPVVSKAGGRAAAGTPVAKEVKKEKVPALSKTDLQYFRGLLLERRREIIGDVGAMESEAFKGGSNLSNMPIHMADVGTDNFEQEFTLGLIESERQTLREIQEALVRIDGGTYGICQGTGRQIPRARLEAVPWAKYSIEYKRLLDQGKVGADEGSSSDDDSGDDDED